MKLALEICAAPPPWLRPLLAVPTTVPPVSTATKVRPGGSGNHIRLAWDSVVSRSQENVSPARTMPSMNAHIPGQSCGVAALISMAASMGPRGRGRNRVSARPRRHSRPRRGRRPAVLLAVEERGLDEPGPGAPFDEVAPARRERPRAYVAEEGAFLLGAGQDEGRVGHVLDPLDHRVVHAASGAAHRTG